MSVDFALQRLGVKSCVTDNHEFIRSADKVVFPGVGEASTTMKYLSYHKLDLLIRDLKQPVLGICLGLQLMCSRSEEGDTDCLGIFNEKIQKFIPDGSRPGNHKVPHMGWNNIYGLQSEIFNKKLENQYVYFVHSYYATTGMHTVATCDYIVTFSAALKKDNFYATQFHPEKSGRIGAQILKNFIEL